MPRIRSQIVEYDVRTIRPFAASLDGNVYDVLPCEVEITARFLRGKDALEWEKRVREELEALARNSEDAEKRP